MSIYEQYNPTNVSIQHGVDHYDDSAMIHALVDEALKALKLPEDYVRPGDRVVLKPNWVKEHDERHPGPDQWEHVVTHPSVIESVIRWVAKHLKGNGSITICDAPQTDSSFAKLSHYCGLEELIEQSRINFPGLKIELLDLRPEEWESVDGVTVSKKKLSGDPMGNTFIALNDASEFFGFSGNGQLYGASFNINETNEHHHDDRHEYMLCRTPMDADVLINIPKLKTHKKVGLTCALKNLVGINANKNWLPHHTEGTPDMGGDQFPIATTKARLEHSWMGRVKRIVNGRPILSRMLVPLKKVGRLFFGDTQKIVRSGNWHGNDTCWRMVLDLNKCLFDFDGSGQARKKPLRYLAVVDGIVGGEGNGPMAPDRKPCGTIIAGTHPASVDITAATLMGFNWQDIRLLKNAFVIKKRNFVPFTKGNIQVTSNKAEWNGPLSKITDWFEFVPHFGWLGAIERNNNSKLSEQ